VRVEFIDKTNPDKGTIASVDTAIPTDEAGEALKKQLESLCQSEALQRQRVAQMMQPRPMSREEKLSSWRAAGAEEADLQFLEQNPRMVDLDDLTRVAAAQAAEQGHERGTPEHREVTKALFDHHLAQAQQAQPAASPAATPAFFQPPEPTRSPAAPDRGSIYSAPVSRTVPGYREPSPRQVKLTGEEQQIARASGISDVQYAANKLKMLRERAAGERE
jgi:hypothetical protein